MSPFGSTAVESLIESYIGADNLLWEKAIKADLGIEGRLFGDKVNFVVDFFNDKRDGIFQQRVQVPEYVGLISQPYSNVGAMRSYGADGNISFTQRLGKNTWLTLRCRELGGGQPSISLSGGFGLSLRRSPRLPVTGPVQG